MSNRGPRLGPAIYRALDGCSDLACIITDLRSDEGVSITVFPPGGGMLFYNRIEFNAGAGPQTAKPGTCYMW